MKYENEAVDAVITELDRFHVKCKKEATGSNHIQISWRVTSDKEERHIIVANTPSDWRASMNNRALVRRFLRHDGVKLDPPTKAPSVPTFKQIFKVPNPVESLPVQVAALRSEVADLASLLEYLSDQMTAVHAALITPVLAPLPVVAHASRSVRSINLLEYMTYNPRPIEELALKVRLPNNIVYRKLNYLQKQGKVECVNKQWRLKQAATIE